MVYATIYLYAQHPTKGMCWAASDLVEFYADVSPPRYQSEFQKDNWLIEHDMWIGSALAAINRVTGRRKTAGSAGE